MVFWIIGMGMLLIHVAGLWSLALLILWSLACKLPAKNTFYASALTRKIYHPPCLRWKGFEYVEMALLQGDSQSEFIRHSFSKHRQLNKSADCVSSTKDSGGLVASEWECFFFHHRL